MDPPVSSNATQPSNTGRVQLPSIKNLVDTLPPPNAYRSLSAQSTWVSPFHPVGSDSSNVQSNGSQRNRLPAFPPPALQTPPPRYRPADSPYTATASPSVVFSSASSGTSEPSMGDRVRPPHSTAPSNRSVSDAPMRTPQDPRTNSPSFSGTTASSIGSYRTIRPSHSLVSQIPSIPPHPPQQPHTANLGSRLPLHSSGGASSTPTSTSTATAISTRLNVAPALNQDRGGKHRRNGQDPRSVPSSSDRQPHYTQTFSPPSFAGHPPPHLISPASERPLPPRIDTEYMDRQQHHYQAEGGVREDQIQNRSRSRSSQSQSRAGQHSPPTPPWEHQRFRAAHRSSSVRELDPGDVRSRSTKYPYTSQHPNDAHTSTTHGASYHSHRTAEHSGPYTSRETDSGEDRRDHHASTGQGFGLRPARWSESNLLYRPEEMDSRRHEYHGQPANATPNRHSVMHHDIQAEDEHGVLATRSDRRYQPIMPAPSQPQRQYVAIEEPKSRPGPGPVLMRNRRQGPDEPMHAFPPRHAGPSEGSAPFPPGSGARPPLPKGLIRHRTKDDLGRALQELTNEANHAMAEGRAMKKIHEFSRVVQLFAAHCARYPGPPGPSPEDVEEMSHRAVLIYRMAQSIKARILAKKAAAANPPQPTGVVPQPPGTRAQKKKKPITKEEKQVQDDMERIRRKRTAAQQGIKSKYMKRNKKTIAPKQCASCNTKETPEWRKGPDGPRSLCNACGLHWAKLQRKRKEDGQWIGEGAPPPIDIITLRQVTGVGLQPRFNERGELEIPGTYKNIPANRSLIRYKIPSTSTSAPDVSMANHPANESTSASSSSSTSTVVPMNRQASPSAASSENNALSSTGAHPTEVSKIAIERLSMEDGALPQSQPQQQSPVSAGILTDVPEGRGKKRKASRDHGDRDIGEDEIAAPSLKKRRASPRQTTSNMAPADTGQPPTPAEETVWQRAF